MRKVFTAVSIAALTGVTALSLPPVRAYGDDSSFTSTAGVGPMSGQQIYEHICQGCHMPGAQGASGAGFYPKLAGDKKLISWQYAALTVLNGKNGMPPFGLPADQVLQLRAAHLSDQQVADVINYVRSHFDNKYPATVTAKQVAALPHPAASTGPSSPAAERSDTRACLHSVSDRDFVANMQFLP